MSKKAYDLEKDGIVNKDGVLNEGFEVLNEDGGSKKKTKVLTVKDEVRLGDKIGQIDG